MSAAQQLTLPTHLGIILDGNRRWARAHKLPTFEGHRRGYDNLKTIGVAALQKGVAVLSAYVFSAENWKRSEEEVGYLMDLLHKVASKDVEELHQKNIRVRFAGSRDRLRKETLAAMDSAELKTAANTGGTMLLCLNYGGQQEIALAAAAAANNHQAVTRDSIEQHLFAADLPPVDMIIRTSGEQRISNFMLWRAAYSELYFLDKHWPAFNEDDLDEALMEFSRRQRRYGA